MVKKSYVLIISSLLLVTGCANDYSGNTYESKTVGEISHPEHGTVISTRKIKIKTEGEKPGTGALIGGATGAGIGALAGSVIGNGDHKLLGATVGGIAGGIGGHMVQNRSQDGVEYQVKLDNGQTITLTQGVNPPLSVGQRVSVIPSEKGRSRIVPGE